MMTAVSTFGAIKGLNLLETYSQVELPSEFLGAGQVIRAAGFDQVDEEFLQHIHYYSQEVATNFATEYVLASTAGPVEFADVKRLVRINDLRWPTMAEFVNFSNRNDTLHRRAPLVNLGFHRSHNGYHRAAVIVSDMDLKRYLRSDCVDVCNKNMRFVLVQKFQ